MLTFNVTGFLTDFTNGLHQITSEVPATHVGEALAELWRLYPGLRDRVLNERGELRQHVNVFLDSENIRRKEWLKTPVGAGSEITILPSVTGGSGEKGQRGRGKGEDVERNSSMTISDTVCCLLSAVYFFIARNFAA